MVSSPDDANISDLGSMSANLGKLSIDDADDSLGMGDTSPTGFQKAGIPNEGLS
jgi:hypothetical protein